MFRCDRQEIIKGSPFRRNDREQIGLSLIFRMTSMRTHLILVALLSVSLASVAHADDWQPEPGFRSLFNGRDLTGWCFRAKVDGNSPRAGDVTEKFDGKTESSDVGAVLGPRWHPDRELPQGPGAAHLGSSTPWRSFPRTSPSSLSSAPASMPTAASSSASRSSSAATTPWPAHTRI